MASPQLDLAFAMDCTGSMGAYIASAKENIRMICEDIVASEKANVQLALVEYRDHPPQENTFVTRTNDFTPSISRMRSWLEQCSAVGGGDRPEAVADALHELLKLSWREGSTKLAVLVSDAPPHGIGDTGDTMPNGCPLGHDPMFIAHQLAEKDVTLYVVGVEPSILPFKDFFMALAHAAGGRYVPLSNARVLAKAIIASAQEEISLAAAMAQVRLEVEQAAAAAVQSGGGAAVAMDEEAVTDRVHRVLMAKGVTTKQMVFGEGESAPPEATSKHIGMAKCANLESLRKEYAEDLKGSEGAPEHAMMSARAGMPRMAPRMAMPSRRIPESVPLARSMAAGVPPPPAPAAPYSLPEAKALADFGAPMEYAAAAASFAAPGSHETSYKVKESAVSYSQASRMVQKAMRQIKPPASSTLAAAPESGADGAAPSRPDESDMSAS